MAFNAGNTQVFPKITFVGSGTIYQVANLTTGDEINFNYTLQSGEEAILDLEAKTFVSNFYGNLLIRGAIVTGSDVATFKLIPGANDISVLMTAGSMFVEWDTKYLSFDG